MVPTAAAEPATVTDQDIGHRTRGALARLLHDDAGRLIVRDGDLEKLLAIVEVAARIADDRSEIALLEVVRFAMALESEGHDDASRQFFDALKRSDAALRRLDSIAKKDKRKYEIFRRFSDVEAVRRAPHHDAEHAVGVPLKTLLPAHAKTRKRG